MKRINKFCWAIGAATFAFSVVVGSAFAGSGTSVSGYAGVAGQVQSAVKGHGTLPFTGLDLGLVAGVAALALVAGLVITRLTRQRA
jgi:hypothetical protein